MKKIIKIVLIIVLVIVVILGTLFGYKKYIKYKNDNKIITYVLNNPYFPLEDSNKEEYIVNTYLSSDIDQNGKFEVKIENGKVILIKNGNQTIVSNISNAKYITSISNPFILTSDGKLYGIESDTVYCCEIIGNFQEARLTGYYDIDRNYVPGESVNEKFVALVSKVDGVGALNKYAKTEDNKYYKLNTGSIELVEDLNDDTGYDIAYSGYGYLLYNDGKVSYTEPFNNTATITPKGIVIDENGNQLVAYKFIAKTQGKGYFVSTNKKLYEVFAGTINENNELEAKLINASPVVEFSYKNNAKDDIIVNFENGESFTIEKSLYKVSYKVYND